MTSRSKGLGKISANDEPLSDLRPLTIMQSVRAGWKAVTLFAGTSAPIRTNTPNKRQHTQAFMAQKTRYRFIKYKRALIHKCKPFTWVNRIYRFSNKHTFFYPCNIFPAGSKTTPVVVHLDVSSLGVGLERERERRRGELRDEERRSGGEQESA